MENKRKIALFDFCETLTNFQTADRYVRYVMSKNTNVISKGLQYYLQIFLEKSKISAVLFRLGININKFMLLNNLKGLSYDVLNQEAKNYYQEEIKPNLIKETIQELKRLKADNYEIVIVSGGYDIYLHYFAQEYNIDQLLCSNLLFKESAFTGSLDGKDCMGDEKVVRLKKLLDKCNVDSYESIAYSDSISDLPFLKFANQAVVVSRKPQKWAKSNHFNTLLWQK